MKSEFVGQDIIIYNYFSTLLANYLGLAWSGKPDILKNIVKIVTTPDLI